MHLIDITSGSRVFVDASIFYDHITKNKASGKSCRTFLQRIEKHDVEGFTSVIALNELLHKLAIVEIRQRHGLSREVVMGFIDSNPSVLRDLKVYQLVSAVAAIPNLQVFDVVVTDFAQAIALMQKHQLLSNDALHVAVMQRNGLDMLAAKDSDFQRVPWLKLYRP